MLFHMRVRLSCFGSPIYCIVRCKLGVVTAEPMQTNTDRRIQYSLIFIAIFLGGLYSWMARNTMSVDGVVYLDIADAYRYGNWHDAINAYYSPLYSWLLGLSLAIVRPSRSSEAACVHALNFLIYLWTLFAFEMLMQQLLASFREDPVRRAVVPEACWRLFGYGLFFWSALVMIGVAEVTPDLCVSGFVYAGTAILIRLSRANASRGLYPLLGGLMGLGYLTKNPMLIIGLGTIAIATLRSRPRSIVKGLIALTTFVLFSGPFILLISREKGHLTIGEVGGWNYTYFINGHPGFDLDGVYPSVVHWQGLPAGTGTPLHSTQRIGESPAVYAFGSPIGGSYPPLYDPSYWFDGVSPHFDLKGQLRVLAVSFRDYFHIFFYELGALPVSLTILLLSGWRLRRGFDQVRLDWIACAPALIAMGMYAFVHVESRYLGSIVVLLSLGLFGTLQPPERKEMRTLLAVVLVSAALVTGLKLSVSIAGSLSKSGDASAGIAVREQVRIADALLQNGVHSKDTVAFIGLGVGAYWARLAGVKIVAEVPATNLYWSLDASKQSRINEELRSAGASLLIAKGIPAGVPNPPWIPLENTMYYLHRLD